MQMSSLAATTAAFFLPSRYRYITIGKLSLLGMLFTTLFLFTSAYNFPGGASHYPNWAMAIVNGTKLPPDLAQREVGFPLLYLLSGFTLTHSFIGLTLILAMFAILMSVLCYLCLERISPTVGYLTGLACILSLSPFTYLKFFYPDQAYIFFNLLAVTFLITFIQSKGEYRWLYLLTMTALMASFTRTAGNLMYPALLVIAYLSVRGRIRHYFSCLLIFSLFTGLYQWHRYEIFDMRNQPSIPSGKGMQILYSTYLFLGDFGERLSPDYGPNSKRLFERMREELGSNVRHSPLIKKRLGESPDEFMEKHFFVYTPEQLIEKISTEPNEEYYWNVIMGVDTNDQFFLDVAKEIMRAKPWYVVQYSMRNFYHALFDPGYATTRYNTAGYIHTGNEFIPEVYGWGTHSEDPVTQYGRRAAKEMEYFPLKTAPLFVQKAFFNLRDMYLFQYHKYIKWTMVLIITAWIAALLGLLSQFFLRSNFFQFIKQIGADKMAASVIVASAMVIYEDLLTSFFCQPVYRYFHLTEPLRIVIAGYGLAFISSLFYWTFNRSSTMYVIDGIYSFIQQRDLLNRYFSTRRSQWILLLLGLNVILFAWWVSSMLVHTRI